MEKVIEIEKCTQMDIAFNINFKMLFEMQINGDLYSTDYDYFFCIDQPYLVFKNYKGEKLFENISEYNLYNDQKIIEIVKIK